MDNGTGKRLGDSMGAGIAIGAGLGVALGLALGNLALGIAIGVSLGAALGAAYGTRDPETEDQASRSMRLLGTAGVALGVIVLILVIALMVLR